MFQNIERNYEENQDDFDNIELEKKFVIKEMLKKSFTKQKIILYIVSFMVSLVSFGINKDIAPFGIAMLAAILSNCIPVGVAFVIIGIANFISFGASNTLSYILISLILLFSILVKPPKYKEENNEKRNLGLRLFISCLIVKLGILLFRDFIVYDILFAIMQTICVFIFYKIFTNAIPVINKIGYGKVYSIEEVMGTSLLLAIAVSCIGNFTIFGYCVKNILCILIVLVMGWKNGILVGGTAGITVGTVLGIIGAGSIDMVASYALSGMIAGIFSKFGKIGVVIGFILGNIALTYVANGNTAQIIKIQEILIAALGLLAVPKRMKINIEDVYNTNTKLLPETTGRTLEENKNTIYKLTTMSETISEIARSYKEAAATIVDEEELKEQEKENFRIFEKELQNNIEGIEENILFDDIYSPEDNLVEDIFDELLEKEMLVEKDLIDIFAKHNNYIIVNEQIKEDISKMIKIINYSYKVSKLNFIWKKKLDENKKAVSNQLEEVSIAIETLAEEIEKPEEDKYSKSKQEIIEELKEIQINVKNISISKLESGKLKINLYTNVCEDVEKPTCNIKKMTKIISKILEHEVTLQKQQCGLRLGLNECIYTFTSADKQRIQVGVSKATKEGSITSGDNSIQTRLEDGKFLVAISDGMGSGKKAKRSSSMAIAMLNKLLSSGFDKDTSLRLINSTLSTINDEDMFATLDIAIFDLFSKNLEFIKNGACPTYVKNKRNVQILKSVSLPTGILSDIDLIVYDKDIEDKDILVMCSDGILDSSEEYTNKELWLKFLLEEIETDDVQKIADIILQEAIDNNYGKPKDDMTVIVMKIENR